MLASNHSAPDTVCFFKRWEAGPGMQPVFQYSGEKRLSSSILAWAVLQKEREAGGEGEDEDDGERGEKERTDLEPRNPRFLLPSSHPTCLGLGRRLSTTADQLWRTH